MSQAGESVLVERVTEERIVGDHVAVGPGVEVAESPEVSPPGGHEGLERPMGIAIVVLGLALMALAAI